MSEDELIAMLHSASQQGVIDHEEKAIHNNLFSFADQTAKSGTIAADKAYLSVSLSSAHSDLEISPSTYLYSSIFFLEGIWED